MYEEEKRETPCKNAKVRRVLNLNFHAHEYPLVAGNIKVACPVVESGHLESDPLQALGQLHGFLGRHATIDASDNLGAFQRTITQLNECHKTR